jgi:agmatinase
MKIQNYFADAISNFNDADFVIFSVPYDKTYSFRPGAKKAPTQIRNVSWNFESYDIRTGIDFRNLHVHDYGDLKVTDLKPEKMIKIVKEFTSQILIKKKIPICLGGEHSITPGIVYAFPKDICVLSLDAHLDFRKVYKNEIYNHACVTKRISDHIKIENIGVLGVRSAEIEEYEDAKKKGLFFKTSFEMKNKGLKTILTETKKHFKNKKMYLTIDIDVVDPGYAPGTGTPEPFGITTFDLLEIIDFFSSQIIGFDVVEVNPDFDNGETAILAAKVIRNIIEKISFKKHVRYL